MGDVRYSMCAIQYLCPVEARGWDCSACTVASPILLPAHLPLSSQGHDAASESDALTHLFVSGRRRLLTVLKGAWHDLFFSFYATQSGPNKHNTYMWELKVGITCAAMNIVSLRSMCHVFVCVSHRTACCRYQNPNGGVGWASSFMLMRMNLAWTLFSVYVCTLSLSVSQQHFPQHTHTWLTHKHTHSYRAGGRSSNVEVQRRRGGGADSWT